MAIVNRVAAMQDEIALWRQDFHAHPEIGFDVQRTAGIVADKLKAFGCDEVVPGVGKTGVVGIIKGRKGTSGKVVGLRADMDALPILETTGLTYASTAPGKMHACGHDGHTAMVLGAAKYLAETRNFDGTVVVIFQPNEEGLTGGLAMVEDGLMERFGIQEVYGMHTWPGLAVGKFSICAGAMLAACEKFTIEIAGKGGFTYVAVPVDQDRSCRSVRRRALQLLHHRRAQIGRLLDYRRDRARPHHQEPRRRADRHGVSDSRRGGSGARLRSARARGPLPRRIVGNQHRRRDAASARPWAGAHDRNGAYRLRHALSDQAVQPGVFAQQGIAGALLAGTQIDP